MATYLVYRNPDSNQSGMTGSNIGGAIVNAADAPSALVAAQGAVAKFAGPLSAGYVAGWSNTQLSASDNALGMSGTLITGEVRLPGTRMAGGSNERIPLLP